MPIGDLLAQITGEASSSTSAAPRAQSVPKRKADAELMRTSSKHSKIEQHVANSSRSIEQAKPLIKTSKINMEAHVKSESKAGSRPTAKPQEAPSGPPKKGSHAEIMARAIAGQKAFGQMGRIQNKPVEKGAPRLAGSKAKPNVAAGSRLTPGGKAAFESRNPPGEGHGGKNGKLAEKGGAQQKSNGSKVAASEPVKKLKKSAMATTGYTGTARPNPAAAKATPRPGFGSAPCPGLAARRDSVPVSRAPKPVPSRRYSYAVDDEDDEEDAEDYESDVSSDMEAAVFEVDEEEERAARIARMEDKKEEARLKREAEEKRRRLAARGAGR